MGGPASQYPSSYLPLGVHNRIEVSVTRSYMASLPMASPPDGAFDCASRDHRLTSRSRNAILNNGKMHGSTQEANSSVCLSGCDRNAILPVYWCRSANHETRILQLLGERDCAEHHSELVGEATLMVPTTTAESGLRHSSSLAKSPFPRDGAQRLRQKLSK